MQNRLHDMYFKDTYPIKQYALQDECLYLLYNSVTKFSKIGITTNIIQRQRNLETSGGISLNLIGLCEIEKNEHEPAKYVEKYLHNYFKEKRKQGEWFLLTLCEQLQITNLFIEISD